MKKLIFWQKNQNALEGIMTLNKSKGNMYGFLTHTMNIIKGKCEHGCTYCYMKKWKLNPVRFDEKELKTNLGSGNFIFIGSSCDVFAESIPKVWIQNIINYCKKFDNKYLFQTKNPARYYDFDFPDNFILGATIETNRIYSCMGNTPTPLERAQMMCYIKNKKFLTIEPILDFDIKELSQLVALSGVRWINIGCDSGGNKLPEPSKNKIVELVNVLDRKVNIKKNLKRIMG